jgi:hypothetical protein
MVTSISQIHQELQKVQLHEEEHILNSWMNIQHNNMKIITKYLAQQQQQQQSSTSSSERRSLESFIHREGNSHLTLDQLLIKLFSFSDSNNNNNQNNNSVIVRILSGNHPTLAPSSFSSAIVSIFATKIHPIHKSLLMEKLIKITSTLSASKVQQLQQQQQQSKDEKEKKKMYLYEVIQHEILEKEFTQLESVLILLPLLNDWLAMKDSNNYYYQNNNQQDSIIIDRQNRSISLILLTALVFPDLLASAKNNKTNKNNNNQNQNQKQQQSSSSSLLARTVIASKQFGFVPELSNLMRNIQTDLYDWYEYVTPSSSSTRTNQKGQQEEEEENDPLQEIFPLSSHQELFELTTVLSEISGL